MYVHHLFDIDPIASFGALPVIDGKVRDVNRVGADELWMTYQDWRNRFFEIRDRILNGTF